MSTAYPPRLVRYALSSKKERNAARTSTMAPGFYGHFPDLFGLFYDGPGNDFLSQYFELSAIQPDDISTPSEPLYAVSFHKGPGLLQMTLYSSPQRTSTPMAIAVNERRYSSSAVVTLPGNTTSSSGTRTEHLKQRGYGSSAKYSFSFRDKDFEWREDSSKKPTVRRLVRCTAVSSSEKSADREISMAPGPENDRGDDLDLPRAPAPPNRIEVLATWTEGSVPNRSRQLAALKFSPKLQDEWSTSEDREYFALLAVSAVLVACQHGRAIESTLAWQEEKKLEKGYYNGTNSQPPA